jgi:hypothetical protein
VEEAIGWWSTVELNSAFARWARDLGPGVLDRCSRRAVGAELESESPFLEGRNSETKTSILHYKLFSDSPKFFSGFCPLATYDRIA